MRKPFFPPPLYLVVTDLGDPSVGIRSTEWQIECPFVPEDVDDEERHEFAKVIGKIYEDYSEGKMLLYYSDNEEVYENSIFCPKNRRLI